jgi:peroxiredoxin
MLGQASLKLGRSVGFMGIATRDDPAAAQRFLDGHPVGYPSWSDSSGSLAESVGVAAGLPTTVIYDRSGKRSYIHQGPYESSAALEADIERYGVK